MTRRRTAAAATAVAFALALLTGCTGGDGREPKVVVETHVLEELSDAIEMVNVARADLAKIGTAIGTAAAALNDVDDVAVNADRAAVRARRPAADKAMRSASPAARRLTKAVRLFQAAVEKLGNAPTASLEASQRAAIEAVVAATRKELGPVGGYAATIAGVWPRYEALNEDQKLWLARYSNGWYRDQKEAAGAYVVMTDRKALARDGKSLAAADSRRLAAAKQTDTAIAAASGALASLLG